MNSAKRILIYRLGSLGDTVVAIPCFHLIRRAFPSAHITVLTNHPVEAKAAPLASVLDGSGLFDELLDYPVELRQLRQIVDLRNRIRAGNFDVVVHLTAARGLINSIRDYFFFRWCGIPRVIGVPFRDVGLDSVRIAPGRHEAESLRLVNRLRKLGQIDLRHRESWDLRLTSKERDEAERLLREGRISSPFLALSLGSKLAVKDWTPENWKKLLRGLSGPYPQLSILAVGAEEERSVVDAALAAWKGAMANLCGRTSARVSAALLERASLFIGHDSGPLHLAAAVGTPCVAIFSGHGPPGQWFPCGDKNIILLPEKLCALCSRADCRQINGKCILSISVDEVFAAVKQQLGSISPSSDRSPNEDPSLYSHA
jgi:ADP-heptose:LPS heptosyltransferase